MRTSEAGINFITAEEGERLTVYKDIAGKDTVGVGHLVLPGENFSGGISAAQSRAILRNDLVKAESLVNNRITVPLTQPQFDALVSLAFNVPVAITAGTLDDLINSNADESAIRAKWEEYHYANGIASSSLLARRRREADMFFGTDVVKKK